MSVKPARTPRPSVRGSRGPKSGWLCKSDCELLLWSDGAAAPVAQRGAGLKFATSTTRLRSGQPPAGVIRGFRSAATVEQPPS